MNVNATLLVQIGNFYIAYLLFRHILLRPGYQVLLEKESHRRLLEDTVLKGKQIVENGRQKQKEAWAAFRDWSKKQLPVPLDRSAFFRGISIQIAPQKVSDTQKDKARTQLANAMLSTLKDRYER